MSRLMFDILRHAWCCYATDGSNRKRREHSNCGVTSGCSNAIYGETIMKTWCAAIALTVTASAMIGCTAQARSPEPVAVDRAECARCRMLISTEAGAGEIVSGRDETRFYDDVGCLAADWAMRHDDATAFVRTNAGWRDVASTSFAQPQESRTAMGSGVVAYASAAEAKAADRAGRALTWDDVIRLMGERR